MNYPKWSYVMMVTSVFLLWLLACGQLQSIPSAALPTKTPILISSTNIPAPAGEWLISPLNLDEAVLSVGEEKRWEFEAPMESLILLSLEAHIDWEKLAGGAYIMELVINSAPITGDLLINKPINFTIADGRTNIYYKKAEPNARFLSWAVFYSPDYEANNVPGSGYQVLDGQACLYVFDITSLVKPGRVNEIILSNHGELPQAELHRPIPLKFRQVKLLQKLAEGY